MGLDKLTSSGASEVLSTRLWRRYGAQAIGLLENIREDPEMAEPLIEGTDYVDSFPSWNDLSRLQERKQNFARIQAHSYIRSFLLQTFDDGVIEGDGLLSMIRSEGGPMVHPLLMIGVSLVRMIAPSRCTN